MLTVYSATCDRPAPAAVAAGDRASSLWFAAGVVGMLGMLAFDYRRLERHAYVGLRRRAAARAAGAARRPGGRRLAALAAARPGRDPAVGVHQARHGARAARATSRSRRPREARPARGEPCRSCWSRAPAALILLQPDLGSALAARARHGDDAGAGRRPAALARAARVAGRPAGAVPVVGPEGVPAEAHPHLHRPRARIRSAPATT